MKAKLRT